MRARYLKASARVPEGERHFACEGLPDRAVKAGGVGLCHSTTVGGTTETKFSAESPNISWAMMGWVDSTKR